MQQSNMQDYQEATACLSIPLLSNVFHSTKP